VVFLVQPLSVVVHPPFPTGSARPGEDVAMVNESAITASATDFIGCPPEPFIWPRGRLHATVARCEVHQKEIDVKVRLTAGLFVFASFFTWLGLAKPIGRGSR
jgi:hypothetical protein